MRERDQATRARLLKVAIRLFAERGFARVTVREICRRARANVAAVNYHFGGKEGLYREVIQTAIDTMQTTTAAARAAGQDLGPEERLRAYVNVVLNRIASRSGGTWIHQVMMREISDPTPALDMVLEQVIRPRMTYLCGVISELIGCAADDIRAVRCALSVQSQLFQVLMWTEATMKVAPRLDASNTLDDVSAHITRFTLGGIARTRDEATGG